MAKPRRVRLSSMADEIKELHPLLQRLLKMLPEVVRVEYTHGAREMGADFVFSRRDSTLGHLDHIGVIAKIGRITQDFTSIERQIDECSMPRTFFGGTERIKINEVWVINTSSITQNAQDKINDKYATRKIVFIDGKSLATLIDSHMPDFWTDIPLDVGEYLADVRERNVAEDLGAGLLQLKDKEFYIEQDVYTAETDNYKIKSTRPHKPKRIDIFDRILKDKVLFIEGGMGAGKSKLLRRLVNYYTMPEVYLDTKYLPVPVTFKYLLDEHGGSVKKLITHLIQEEHPELRGTSEKILILIDGVDEKDLAADEQISWMNKIVSELHDATNIKAVITSRYLKAFDSAPEFSSKVARYELRPLTMTRIVEFISKLCAKLNIKTRIIEDIKKSNLLKDLPHSPIAAILLARLLSENSKELPSNMTELYSKCMELMLGRWDIEKGLQSQAEYEALDNLMMILAKYLLNNELSMLSVEQAQEMFKSYLKERNLKIDGQELFETTLERCEIIMRVPETNTLTFKHRSFAEYFYAKAVLKSNSLEIDSRVFNIYWMNMYFFYIGLKKDCPEELRSIVNLKPRSEPERWLRLVNVSNYMLAGFSSPYHVISDGIGKMMTEAAELYVEISERELESPFSGLSKMHLLWLFQMILRDSYSYEFFRDAIEDAALQLDDESSTNKRIRPYAMLFLNMAYIDAGGDDSLDFMLTRGIQDYPLEVKLAIAHESEHIKKRTALMKKQDKNLRKLIRKSPSLQGKLKELYSRPIRMIKKRSKLKEGNG